MFAWVVSLPQVVVAVHLHMYDFLHRALLVFENVVYKTHALLIVQPLNVLYFKGPAFHGLGFWEGIAMEDMCAKISPGTSSQFWILNTYHCEVLMQQRFYAFLTAIQFFVYVFYLYRMLSWLSFRVFIINPTLNRLERIAHSSSLKTY
jgi:hypothetical protein